jgi:DNA replication protein DnaC
VPRSSRGYLLRFINNAIKVLLVGPPGVGKTILTVGACGAAVRRDVSQISSPTSAGQSK